MNTCPDCALELYEDAGKKICPGCLKEWRNMKDEDHLSGKTKGDMKKGKRKKKKSKDKKVRRKK